MKAKCPKTDIIAIGPPFIDLYGEQIGSSLKDMLSFKKSLGGATASTMVGCARLGLRAALLCQLGVDCMSQYAFETLQQENIDVTHISREQTSHCPLLLRGSESKNSFPTFSYLTNQSHFDFDLNIIANCQALLVPSINFFNPILDQVSRKVMIAASENQSKVILLLDDIPLEKSQKASNLQTVLPLCDLIICGSQTDETLDQLRTLSNAIIVVNCVDHCYVLSDQIPQPCQYKGFKTQNHFVFRADSAFASAFLYGWLHKYSLQKSCEFAMASGAIVQSRQNDLDALPSLEEVNHFISHQPSPPLTSPHFEHLHYASTRASFPSQLFTFTFGYHQQWEKIARPYTSDEKKIEQAKLLVAEGLNVIAKSNLKLGLQFDDNSKQNSFEQFPHHYLMRALESPDEIPLRFKDDLDLIHTLQSWPRKHNAKVALTYHPDDRYLLRGQQETTLKRLHTACRLTKHELIIELIAPTKSLITASTTAHIIQRFYEIGIYPDWWQIMPPRDQRSWDSIHRVILENDPHIRGVLITMHLSPIEQLSAHIEFAVKQPICKGFVVGKNLFQHALEKWFALEVNDQSLIEIIANRVQNVIELWTKAEHPASLPINISA